MEGASQPLIRALFYGPHHFKPYPKRRNVPLSPHIASALAAPTWSVRSLMPQPQSPEAPGKAAKSEITREKLHHLLRLSALPAPATQVEEDKLLRSLHDHLHFVRAIQAVDTRDVQPLQAIRDETAEHVQESTVKLADLQHVFDREEVVGRNGRIRSKPPTTNESSASKDEGDGDQPAERLTPAEKIARRRTGQWDPFRMSQKPLESGNKGETERAEVLGRTWRRYFVVKRPRRVTAPPAG